MFKFLCNIQAYTRNIQYRLILLRNWSFFMSLNVTTKKISKNLSTVNRHISCHYLYVHSNYSFLVVICIVVIVTSAVGRGGRPLNYPPQHNNAGGHVNVVEGHSSAAAAAAFWYRPGWGSNFWLDCRRVAAILLPAAMATLNPSATLDSLCFPFSFILIFLYRVIDLCFEAVYPLVYSLAR